MPAMHKVGIVSQPEVHITKLSALPAPNGQSLNARRPRSQIEAFPDGNRNIERLLGNEAAEWSETNPEGLPPFWAQRLAELPPAPQLPMERNSLLSQGGRLICLKRRVDSSTWQAITGRARQYHLRPLAVLLSCYCEIFPLECRT